MTDPIENRSIQLRNNINAQIESINDFIAWTQKNLFSTRKLETFKKLIDQRRLLKRRLFSLSSNPAIAAFGESQKGKSYVVTSLLSYKGQPYTVEDSSGKRINFIEDINPVTNNTEATGVVTRFTYGYSIPDSKFPIKLKLLSVSDIILILCDTYYKDVENRTVIEKEDLDIFIQNVYNTYASGYDVQNHIDEDDVFDIRDYFLKYMKDATYQICSSEFFDILAGVIKKIQPAQWGSVFSKLWSDNEYITALFNDILEGYFALGYAKSVYVPISAVLNINTTLMSSDCLKKLSDSSISVTGNESLEKGTDVAYFENKQLIVVDGFSKSLLSAMTAEAVYKIEENAICEEKHFCLDGIKDEEIRSMLKGKGWNEAITRDFLKSNDILDFPGARSRLSIDESQIQVELCEQMFLRGKVSYLFNKYSDEKLINILLLCHDNEQNGQSVIPSILENWVKLSIGVNAQERAESLAKSVVSPLFLIATKFNKDMETGVSDSSDNQAYKRWFERFNKVLYSQVIEGSRRWFDEWTPFESFKNTYLLRDFKFSGDRGGKSSKLFSGFAEKGYEETEYDPSFRASLKSSFLADTDVKRFISNPELAWDSAATLNNDGSLLIIKNVAIAAGHSKEMRNFKFEKEIVSVQNSVLSMMMDYYHEENEEAMLQKKLCSCGTIMSELDIQCGKDNYFFGRMVQNLQVKENKVFDFYYSFINGSNMADHSNNPEFDLILARCNGKISTSNSFEDNLEILRRQYHFPNIQMCLDYFEKRKNINLTKLFECNTVKKSNSVLMASGVVDKWLCDLSSQKNIKFYESNGCNTMTILDLVENLRTVVNSLGLSDIIAQSISPYVDTYTISLEILDMIADMTAETINSFVNDFGYSFYTEDKLSKIKSVSQKNDLNLSFDYYVVNDIPENDEQLASLFDSIRPTEENVAGQSGYSPAFINYQKWIDYLQISFIAAFNVPDYDVEANRVLGAQLDVYRTIK